MASTSGTSSSDKVQARTVLYCDVCSFPPEYCEFSSKSSKCKTWLQGAHPNLYAKYYSDTALEDKIANLTVEQKEALEKDIAKKERKEEAKAEKEAARVAASKVIIKRSERNKRKFVTSVHGLDFFGVDLKKAAKLFANKFATGASLHKNPQGEEEIIIQGDVSDEVEEMLCDEDDKKAFAVFGGKIGEDQIEYIEERPKKKPPPTIAPQ
ncbi:translation initiation factor SUI1 [Leucosporidium creatinivorum]|uniref:Translation machinery-associated protein 22 n=1 Tax=Leucosporidium creatinivorum TaxID=106004 RepID=A0A1Y2G1T4_9BASI|nr:translation initiation factor SUI1 [Leucosporidium creatinivorum]